MFFTIKESIKEFHPTKEKMLNLILFIFLSGLMPLFTLGNFSFSKNAQLDGSQPFFYDFVKYYPGVAPSLWIAIPLATIFICLWITLYIRIRENSKKEKIILAIITSFILFRAISIFSFPYGNIDYNYISPFNHEICEVNYVGFNIKERLTGFLYDTCFYSYFAIFFISIKKIAKDNKLIFHLIYILIEAVVLVIIIFSLITEFSKYINNFDTLFVHPKCSPFQWITSFGTHRNVYGFFLFIGTIFMLAEFFSHENLLSLILCLGQYFICLLILSKTPFLLLTILLLLTIFLYPIFHFKDHKGYSIFFIVDFLIVVLYFGISYIFFKDCYFNEYIKPLFEQLTAWGTMHARKDITQSALTMLYNPYYVLFGYSRFPFMTIFGHYNALLPIDHTVTFNTHNSLVDILMNLGIIGLLYMALFFALIIRRLITRLFYEKRLSSLKYLILLVIILTYSYSEPRFLLLEEGSSIIFAMMLSFPYVIDNDDLKQQLVKNINIPATI